MEQDAEREEISQPGESDQDGSEWKEIPLSRARARRGIEGKFPRPVDDSGAGCGTAGNFTAWRERPGWERMEGDSSQPRQSSERNRREISASGGR